MNWDTFETDLSLLGDSKGNDEEMKRYHRIQLDLLAMIVCELEKLNVAVQKPTEESAYGTT